MKNITEPSLKKFLKSKVILITGGAGSIGSGITKELLKYPIKAIRVLDVNEHSLFILKHEVKDNRLRPLLGSILDQDRVEMASNGADIIIHAAAIKNIEISEFNPIETLEVNTIGTSNMIKAVMRNKPDIFLNISTDKASEPSTLYGTTKQLGERLTSWAGVHITSSRFGTVRFGNVIETRGNVFELWKNQKDNNEPLTITDKNMKRYFFHMNDATAFILKALKICKRGEILVPKMKEQLIKDLAAKISTNQKITGKRQGEKLREQLLSEEEKKMSTEKKDMWIIRYYKPGIPYP